MGTRGFIELFPGFADRVLPPRVAGLGDADLDGRARRDLGASWMVLRSAITGLANVVVFCTLIMSLAILAFAATDAFYLALPGVFVAGAMMTITGTGAQTLIQAAVDDRMSGRVMALYGMIFRAGPAVGAVLMGTLSEYLGLRLALALGAIVWGSFWLATRFRHKRMAAGLEARPKAVHAGPLKH